MVDNLPTIQESDVLTALRTFLLSLVNCEVIRGQTNRVPMPKGDFIALTPLLTVQLETPVSTYHDIQYLGTQNIQRSTRFDIQIDSYGASACDRANTISILLRTEYACDQFKASGFDIQPLYGEDPKQIPLITGEEQYLERWTFTAVLQCNPVVSIPQDFADKLIITHFNAVP
jgi:hypothetical protein